ncbi:hypothetical protein [Flavobacterium agrisoli]|uniref:Outer membrane protein with beta-barrel domain n=1 Tax=Flavobacterium agrisoli TaxID=2793066 RepID=A0A934PLL7_9FLAO|nr:hypothetical protein [Flavobacterium agrisoli]MBK0370437.1 hypothetical protein [Flavobacterium agrisoli]
MKKIIFFTFLLSSTAIFSQQLSYGSCGTVYDANQKKVKPMEVRKLMENNPEALKLYNAGRSKKTWGNVLFYGGIGLVATNVIVAMNNDNTTFTNTSINYGNSSIGSVVKADSERSNMTAAIIGGAMIVASIPIKIGYPKRIKSALGLYNDKVVANSKPDPKTTLLASTNQLGFKIEF